MKFGIESKNALETISSNVFFRNSNSKKGIFDFFKKNVTSVYVIFGLS